MSFSELYSKTISFMRCVVRKEECVSVLGKISDVVVNKFAVVTVAAFAFVATLAGALAFSPAAVNAAGSQGGVQQVVINPGGGKLADGSDGIKFFINAGPYGGVDNDTDEYYIPGPGSDQIYYRNTYQYCCGGGAPMLNIGGQLYGEAGAAENEDGISWDNVEIVSTSGSAVTGNPVGQTGNAQVVIRYSVYGEGEQSYELTRTINYTYPNNYVRDTYQLYIPDDQDESASEQVVKFYYGGDTAPGSSDQGYGIMFTDPIRDVLSLNPESRIIYGIREVQGSKQFDGAVSQDYSERYEEIAAGTDLGFVVEKAYHDAGLNIQWNFGGTPGSTQTAAMEQYVSPAGRMLKASFDRSGMTAGSQAKLKLKIENADVNAATGIGYEVTLPAGLTIAAGQINNGCGGTATGTTGGSIITLSGASSEADSSCVLYVPVTASSVGTYTVDADSADDVQNAFNVISPANLEVRAGIDPGLDLNGDGVEDADQSNVQSVTSPFTGAPAVIEVDENECYLDSWELLNESDNAEQDADYDYSFGLYNFEAGCDDDGYTTTVRQYYYGDINPANLVGRKYDTNTNTYYTIDQSDVSVIDIYGNRVVLLTYEVTDGGALDMDGEVNGTIIDPAGLGVDPTTITNGATGTGSSQLASTGMNTTMLILASLGVMGTSLIALRKFA